jgi:hypothetical protein
VDPQDIQAADVHLEGTHFDVFIEVDTILDVGLCHLALSALSGTSKRKPSWQRTVFKKFQL